MVVFNNRKRQKSTIQTEKYRFKILSGYDAPISVYKTKARNIPN